VGKRGRDRAHTQNVPTSPAKLKRELSFALGVVIVFKHQSFTISPETPLAFGRARVPAHKGATGSGAVGLRFKVGAGRSIKCKLNHQAKTDDRGIQKDNPWRSASAVMRCSYLLRNGRRQRCLVPCRISHQRCRRWERLINWRGLSLREARVTARLPLSLPVSNSLSQTEVNCLV
jgi:hypothetical protein